MVNYIGSDLISSGTQVTVKAATDYYLAKGCP